MMNNNVHETMKIKDSKDHTIDVMRDTFTKKNEDLQ